MTRMELSTPGAGALSRSAEFQGASMMHGMAMKPAAESDDWGHATAASDNAAKSRAVLSSASRSEVFHVASENYGTPNRLAN